jgi:hypothetical protein
VDGRRAYYSIYCLGTTTGARWSGEAVARRICGKYGMAVTRDADVTMDIGSEDVKSVDGEVMKKELDKEKMDGANLSVVALRHNP